MSVGLILELVAIESQEALSKKGLTSNYLELIALASHSFRYRVDCSLFLLGMGSALSIGLAICRMQVYFSLWEVLIVVTFDGLLILMRVNSVVSSNLLLQLKF